MTFLFCTSLYSLAYLKIVRYVRLVNAEKKPGYSLISLGDLWFFIYFHVHFATVVAF